MALSENTIGLIIAVVFIVVLVLISIWIEIRTADTYPSSSPHILSRYNSADLENPPVGGENVNLILLDQLLDQISRAGNLPAVQQPNQGQEAENVHAGQQPNQGQEGGNIHTGERLDQEEESGDSDAGQWPYQG